ncbi:MAG: hypothetical protein KF833_10925 [Verrucomicrobiae bacterium]|nr:hypothetical protein [Verrucomicrobiae bacterium]
MNAPQEATDDSWHGSPTPISRRGPGNSLRAKYCNSVLALAFGLLLDQAPAASDPSQNEPPVRESLSWATSLQHLGRLHRDDDHPWFQEFWILGRYHGQFHWAEGSAGDSDGWESRRFRMGAQARLFRHLTLHAQMVAGTDFDPFYNGFTELWAQWAFAGSLALTVGPQKHRFTHDRTVSSRYINTIERTLLVNLFNAEYSPAVTLSGTHGRLGYYTGLFSNTTGPDIGEALTHFTGGASFLASVNYDLGSVLDFDTAHLNVGLLLSDANDHATVLNRFPRGLSSALIVTRGPLSLIAETVAGLGHEDGDAWALHLQPGWFMTRQFQWVARYQAAFSNRDTGLRAQRRYERPAGLRTGDFYQAVYLGLNHYLAEHRFKLMTGVEYARLDGDSLWTALAAVRVFWGPHARGPFPAAQVLAPR